jgi:hypothetical protein
MRVRWKRYIARKVAIKLHTTLYMENLKVPDRLRESYRVGNTMNLNEIGCQVVDWIELAQIV